MLENKHIIPIREEIKENEFKNRKVPIVEIFGDTIQGEGPRLRPAIFVRTGSCNLTCAGFGCSRPAPDGTIVQGCDTIHAVSPKFKSTWTEYTQSSQLIERVVEIRDRMEQDFIGPGKVDIIVTGGEPTLHWDSKVFQEFLEYFVSQGHHITIETNATKLLKFTKWYQSQLSFSMSVKLSVSGEPERKRLNLLAINNILEHTNSSYFKFVVNPETWEDTRREIQYILENTGHPTTYLMPLGETTQKQLEHTRFVFDVCAKYGFNFTPRAHILAYDDVDGV